jgi:hypothetical protein
MAEIKADKNLERALSSVGSNAGNAINANANAATPNMPKNEEIAFHKGALNTLMAERNEMVRVVANVEAIMQMHLARLQELGVKIEVQRPQTTEKK